MIGAINHIIAAFILALAPPKSTLPTGKPSLKECHYLLAETIRQRINLLSRDCFQVLSEDNLKILYASIEGRRVLVLKSAILISGQEGISYIAGPGSELKDVYYAKIINNHIAVRNTGSPLFFLFDLSARGEVAPSKKMRPLAYLLGL